MWCRIATQTDLDRVQAAPGPAVISKMADPKTRLPTDSTRNNRLDALHDPWIVVLFMIPGAKTTVRVNGRADLHMSFAKGACQPETGRRRFHQGQERSFEGP